MADTTNTTKYPQLLGSCPAEFTGTTEELKANIATHRWMDTMDDGIRCDVCDCRLGGGTAAWPCGQARRYQAHRIGIRGWGIRMRFSADNGVVIGNYRNAVEAVKAYGELLRTTCATADVLQVVADVSMIGWTDTADGFYYHGAIMEDRDGSGWLMMRTS